MRSPLLGEQTIPDFWQRLDEAREARAIPRRAPLLRRMRARMYKIFSSPLGPYFSTKRIAFPVSPARSRFEWNVAKGSTPYSLTGAANA